MMRSIYFSFLLFACSTVTQAQQNNSKFSADAIQADIEFLIDKLDRYSAYATLNRVD
ncbi:MAG: hypothetical protein AAGI23_16750 [Bacteroidota bacterium]